MHCNDEIVIKTSGSLTCYRCESGLIICHHCTEGTIALEVDDGSLTCTWCGLSSCLSCTRYGERCANDNFICKDCTINP